MQGGTIVAAASLPGLVSAHPTELEASESVFV